MSMSATVVHIILSHLTANVILRLQVNVICYRTRSTDDLIKGISYLNSTSLATGQSAPCTKCQSR